MIDKVNGNGGYDFPGNHNNKRKNSAVKAYENTPGAKEARNAAGLHKKSSADTSGQKESGVILDLSGKATGRKKDAYAGGRKKDSSLADALRKLITPIVQWLKDFWGPGRPQGENADAPDLETQGMQLGEGVENEDPMEIVAQMPLADTDSELPPLDEFEEIDEMKALTKEALKSGSLRQIEQVVTQNGKKRLAHNSDLLTYYDRRGKFVEMDETEKYRVLFGDKNVLKL